MLFITGLILATTYFSLNRPIRQFTLLIAFCIGIAQACALMPGISRSGITISVALLLGIRHQDAAKFSFFMAIPALLGAGLFEVAKIDHMKLDENGRFTNKWRHGFFSERLEEI